MDDFPTWLKIVIWLLVGGTLTYAVVMSVLSIAGH